MSTTFDESLSAIDRQVIDQFRSAVDQLTPAGFRKLLSLLADKCLAAQGGTLPLENDSGEVFACLYSTERPVGDFAASSTATDVARIKRYLFDPKNSRPWREVLAQLAAEDDRE